MCFSLPVSVFLSVTGLILAKYHETKGRLSLRDVIYFYTLMEIVQSLQHLFLGQCGSTINFWLTAFSHIPVVVQPLMWNLHRGAMTNNVGKKNVFAFASLLSLIWAVFYSLRLLPIGKFGVIEPALDLTEIMVGSRTCTHSGPVHLYWLLPYRSYSGLEPNLFTYLLLWFVPSLYERVGRQKILVWLSQIILIQMLVGSIHELPTIWCALSVPFLLTSLLNLNSKPTLSIWGSVWQRIEKHQVTQAQKEARKNRSHTMG
jgi:hypothetical protein